MVISAEFRLHAANGCDRLAAFQAAED